MKKMFLLLLLAVSIHTLGLAQEPQAKLKKATTAKPSKAKQLGLSKDQQDKIKETNKEAKTKRAAIKGDKTLTDSQKKEQVKAVNKEHKDKLDKVYTPEQKTKMKEMKAQKKATAVKKKRVSPKTAVPAKA